MSQEVMLSAVLLKGRQNLGQRLSASLLPRQQAHGEASVACDQLETRNGGTRAGVVGSVPVFVTRYWLGSGKSKKQ